MQKGPLMKTVFVGLRQGEKSLNIPYIIVMALALPAVFATMFSALTYYAMGALSGPIVAYGAVMGLIFVMVGILSGMMARKKNLKELDD